MRYIVICCMEGGIQNFVFRCLHKKPKTNMKDQTTCLLTLKGTFMKFDSL
jgi:hypothetical protein